MDPLLQEVTSPVSLVGAGDSGHSGRSKLWDTGVREAASPHGSASLRMGTQGNGAIHPGHSAKPVQESGWEVRDSRELGWAPWVQSQRTVSDSLGSV